MRTAQLRSPVAALALTSALGFAGAATESIVTEAQDVQEIWIEPADLEKRNLFRGPSEGPPPPDSRTPFAFVKIDTSGTSPGYDVRSADDAVWSVKLGEEAQSEVTSSRILWAIGYHQPPTYYLSEWTMTGQEAGPKAGGRFRPEISGQKVVGEWKWDANPFVGTRPLAGLLVAQMMLNSWDLKSSNNKIYEVTTGAGPRRWFVVRDLGASLGENKQEKIAQILGIPASQGKKNDIDEFEQSSFIDKIPGGRVKFSYQGPHERLVAKITPADVKWTAQLMSRLSDAQWQDAFRAGGYTPEVTARYIRKLKERVAQGLGVEAPTSLQPARKR